VTGKTKDIILGLVDCNDELRPDEQKELVDELLDYLCFDCGARLPKYGECSRCGTVRPNEAPDYKYLLLNLLAVIHGDGGHYTHDHGVEKSVEDAIAIFHRCRSDLGV